MRNLIILILVLFSSNLFSQGVSFKKGKAQITPDSYKTLDALGKKIVKAIKKNPNLKIKIMGHTDNRGSIAVNNKLSLLRANAVRDYLVKKFNLDQAKFITKGMGPSQPIASNDTAEGRNKNRRVEVVIQGEKIVLTGEIEEPDAWIKWLKNNVKYQPKDKPVWKDAQINKALYRLWKVNTLKKSISTVQFKDNSTLDMSPETLITIYGNIGDAAQKLKNNKYHVELSTGELFNKLKSITPKKNLNISTPACGLSIFSKENNIEVNKKDSTLASIYEGYVKAVAQGKTVKVPAGYGNITEKGKAPGKPIPLPKIPSKFDAKNLSGKSLNIKWKNAPNVAGYNVQLSTDKEFRNLIINKKVDKNEIEVTNLAYGKTYYYRVRAIDSVGLKSKFSKFQKIIFKKKSISLRKIPSKFNVKNVNGKSLNIKWKKAPNVAGYNFQLSTDKEFKDSIINTKVTKNKIQVNNLADGKTYYYRVSSFDRDGSKSQFSKFQTIIFKKKSENEPPIRNNLIKRKPMKKNVGLSITGGPNFFSGDAKKYIKNGIDLPKLEYNIYLSNFSLIPHWTLYHFVLNNSDSNLENNLTGKMLIFSIGANYEFFKSKITPFLGMNLGGVFINSIPGKSKFFGIIPVLGLKYKINASFNVVIHSDYIYSFNNLNLFAVNFGIEIK